MRLNINTTAIIIALLLILSNMPAIKTYAASSYNYDIQGNAVPSQAGYTAEKAVYGKNIGISEFSAISDIFRNDNGDMLIADSGNNRIVIADDMLESVSSVIDKISFNGEISELKAPEGVCFSAYDSMIYIADTGNSRIIRCDENGIADMIITKPNSVLYNDDDNAGFFPKRISIDRSGCIYATVSSSTNGVLMFSADGEFMGYFAANHIKNTAEAANRYFRNLFATYDMRIRKARSIPAAFTSFDIDSDGFMFTCTETADGSEAVKKIDFSGDNLYQYSSLHFGDYTDYYDIPEPSISDIDISESGYINCIDRNSGRIFQYDKQCRLMFITGGKSNQLGYFSNISAIESTDDYLFAADYEKNCITIFKITEFGSMVHNAEKLGRKGEYEQALPIWLDVLERDGNYRIAYDEISDAMFFSGDYENAMQYAEQSMSSERYNKAFEEYRAEHSGRYFIYLIIFLAICITAIIMLKKIFRRHGDIPLKYAFDCMMKPSDSFEDAVYKKKCSVKLMYLIIFFLFLSELISDVFFGFQFTAYNIKTFSIIPYIFKSVVYFALWCIGNWSVCCLLDGKGTFRNICVLSSYALIPYIIQNFICLFLSHILVRDESFFITAVKFTGIMWTAILLFIAVKSVHQYSARKTLSAVMLTFIAMIIIFFIMVLMLMLFKKIYIFIYSIATEIIYRIRI
ncbi:MAG: YIP1 family protein [Oscillospiraceae bacterium]